LSRAHSHALLGIVHQALSAVRIVDSIASSCYPGNPNADYSLMHRRIRSPIGPRITVGYEERSPILLG